MQTLLIDHDEVRRLLPMAECVEAMAEAFGALARGEAVMPLRGVASLPEGGGLLLSMPSMLPSAGVMGMKVISFFAGNSRTPFESHQGAVLLFETANGRLLAIMDASEITAIRTAAVSGLATRLLAREDAGDLAILGSGAQARTHLEAMREVRSLRTVRVWSRTAEHARAFADEAGRDRGIDVEVMPSAREAVDGADVICTVTSSPDPVLLGSWISPGAHVNVVGYSGAAGREVDSEALVRSRLYVDRRESIVAEGGEFIAARREGAVDEDHIVGELGEVVVGDIRGRGSDLEITLFRSLGLAVEDLAAARHIFERATRSGGGTWVELVGERHGA